MEALSADTHTHTEHTQNTHTQHRVLTNNCVLDRFTRLSFCSHQKKVMVFRFCPQILEDDLLHKSLHQVPVLHYPVTNGPLGERKETSLNTRVHKQETQTLNLGSTFVEYDGLSMASSPMKKSRSSTPFIIRR